MGIVEAKKRGVHMGRPRIQYSDNWAECYACWKSGEITAKEAMERMGLKKDSFYRLVSDYEKNKIISSN